jgi:hypothetical protein
MRFHSEKLPNKLSDLLELALKDLATVARSKRYVIDMGDWHYPKDGKCYVCLAGAVLACSGADPNFELFPNSSGNREKLLALDLLRTGNIFQAAYYVDKSINLDLINMPRYVEVCPYIFDKKKWRTDMRKIVKLLKERNL